eukprot:6186644-Pleurochrysis_carterae.AAC.3
MHAYVHCVGGSLRAREPRHAPAGSIRHAWNARIPSEMDRSSLSEESLTTTLTAAICAVRAGRCCASCVISTPRARR